MNFFYFSISVLLFVLLAPACKKTDTVAQKNTIIIQTKQSGVTDADGNIYDTVVIGTQTWIAANLKTTHYANGSPVLNIVDSTEWRKDTTGAYCNYNNDTNNVKIYGHLYNWFAVNNTAGLCPNGWHIPSDSDWSILINYLNGDSIAGGSMKTTGYSLWNPPNVGATNASGFDGLPAGNRLTDGLFYGVNNYAHYWSSTQTDSIIYSWSRYLYYEDAKIYREYSEKQVGFSCRCIEN